MTTAASTTFCAAKIEGPGGHLWIDGNQKITAGNGTFEKPEPNAFSLVQIKDCPGSTPACRESCYVHGLEKHAPKTHEMYVHNSDAIRIILGIGGPLVGVWAKRMADWIGENCKGGFRWHVSGDVFSAQYAALIVDVCQRSPEVGHWIYTRSHWFAETLDRAENLVVNISADADNYRPSWHRARALGLRMCYFTKGEKLPDLEPMDVIFPDYPLRGDRAWWDGLTLDQQRSVCPVDFLGKSDRQRCGPCRKCLVPMEGV